MVNKQNSTSAVHKKGFLDHFFAGLLIVTVLTLILPLNAYSRKPAVEPTMEIDFENKLSGPKRLVEGYQFKKNKIKPKKQSTSKVLPRTYRPTTESGTPGIIITIFLLTLPLFIWLGMVHVVERRRGEIANKVIDGTLRFRRPTVVDRKPENGDDDDDDNGDSDDHYDLPKAS
ncbi:MAG: hypothetical protein ISR65_14385 [Bacteriovoracaceae bacterium]|nr:hypothetical protein [Bacteriovoracaceae bacterium]